MHGMHQAAQVSPIMNSDPYWTLFTEHEFFIASSVNLFNFQMLSSGIDNASQTCEVRPYSGSRLRSG